MGQRGFVAGLLGSFDSLRSAKPRAVLFEGAKRALVAP